MFRDIIERDSNSLNESDSHTLAILLKEYCKRNMAKIESEDIHKWTEIAILITQLFPDEELMIGGVAIKDFMTSIM